MNPDGAGDGIAGRCVKILQTSGIIMASINGVGGNHPIHKVASQPISRQVPATAAPQTSPTDKVELSGISHILSALKTNDVRTEKVAEIKSQIAAGTYDHDGSKLDTAISRLADDLAE